MRDIGPHGGEGRVTVVDAHVHVWDPRLLTYPWLTGAGRAATAHLPGDVDRAGGRTTRMVFVEADRLPEQNVSEVRWAAGLEWPELAAIVAAADARSPHLEAQLDELVAAGPVRGIRHLLQGEDPARFRKPALQRGLEAIAAHGLTFDACVRHEQLDALAELLERVSDLPVVLDHVGKPPVAEGVDSGPGRAWRSAVERIAGLPGAHVKLSGLIPEAPDEATLRSNAGGFLAAALAAFGADRSMVGSDWPVSGLWGPDIGFQAWLDLVREQVADDEAWEAVSHGTAERFYRL